MNNDTTIGNPVALALPVPHEPPPTPPGGTLVTSSPRRGSLVTSSSCNGTAGLLTEQINMDKLDNYGSINGDLERASSISSSTSSDDEGVKVPDLEKTLTLAYTISIAVGQIIGSGIFVSPNIVIKGVGSMGLSLIVWTIGGVLSLCGALCFAELGAICPKAGGEYQYIKMTYGPMVAFNNLWVLLIVNAMAPAVISLTFSTYFLSLFVDLDHVHFDVFKKVIAAVAILIVVAICMYGTKAGVVVQSIFTVTKFVALLFLVGLAVAYLARGHTENITTGFEGSNTDVSEWSGAILSSLWAYNGWNHIAIIASEVQDARRNLPRALILSGVLVTVTYLVLNLAYHVILSPAELLKSESIAVSAAEVFFADYGTNWVLFGRYFCAAAVAISTFGALLSITLSASRLPYAGAKEDMLPTLFGLVSKTNKTPITSLALTGSCAFVCVWPSNVGDLIQSVGFLSWIFWGLCFAGVLVLRWRLPDIPRPFRVPLGIPIIAVLTSAYLIAGSIYATPLPSLIWAAAALAAVPVYYGYVDRDNTCDKLTRKLTSRLLHYLDASE